MANHGGALQARARDRRAGRQHPRGLRDAARRRPARDLLRPDLHGDDDALRGDRRARAVEPGDEIVCTRLDHDSNVRPWVIAAERAGVTVRFAEPERGHARAAGERRRGGALSERTNWVAVTAASNAVGTVPDLEGIVAAAHRVGARVYVDAVHATPHRRYDLAALGADVIACSAYKWFGPHISVLCAAPEILEEYLPGQAQPVAGRGAGPVGARHAAVRVPGGRPRRGRVHARARLRRGPRPRGGAAGDRARRPRRDGPRDALRRRRRTARRR